MGCSAGTHLGAGGIAVGGAGLFGGLPVAGIAVVCDWQRGQRPSLFDEVGCIERVAAVCRPWMRQLCCAETMRSPPGCYWGGPAQE